MLTAPIAPFPGLRTFEPDEDFLFFGRERQTNELLRKLRTTRFLSILGTSGSGKSSLVRSGLIPTLYGGGMTRIGSRWRVAIMRPGEDPLGNLAAALSAPEALGEENAFFETTLRASNRGLVECIRQAGIPPGDNVLVLVDQFEELFRYKHSRRAAGHDEAVAFVKLLLAARQSDVPCYVAITMRSDFIGDCMEFVSLPEVVNEGIYLVPRMTRDELREAITGPVAVGGGTIAPRLVSRLLNDVGDDPDQLPILQHALMRMWNRWEADREQGQPLDLRHYEVIGTMRSALSLHAEEAFGELDGRQQQIAEKLFKALTDKGADVRGVRRPAPIREICALTGATFDEVARVVETFRKPGRSFLMPPPGVPLHDDSILDISHESLMRAWERLTKWVDDEARSAQLYLNVARAAARHEEGSVALWRDPELQFALNWRKAEQPTEQWAARYDPSFARAMKFLDRSQQERDREIRDRERRRRTVISTLSVASLLLAALGVYAFGQKQVAQKETTRAEAARSQAEKALADAKRDRLIALHAQGVAESEKQRASSERDRAEAQSQVAQEQTMLAEGQRQRAETERLKAENAARVAREQETIAKGARQEAVIQQQAAEQQKTIAQTSEKETRRLSHLAAARALALSVLQEKEWKSSQPTRALIPFSALLAREAYHLHRQNGGSEDDPEIFAAMLTAYERANPGANVLRGARDSIRALAITPDGRAALAAGHDGAILRFDLEPDAKAVPIATAGSGVYSLAIRRAGDLFAAGTAAGTIELRDLRNPGTPPRALTVGTRPVSSVAFHPSGSRLAAGSLDGSVTVWDLDRAGAPVTLRPSDSNRVTAVAFSPNGRSLAAAVGGDALVWDDITQPAKEPRHACTRGEAQSLAFAPDNKTLVCGGRRGQIVEDVVGNDVTRSGHASSVNSLGFSANGELFVSASSDGLVHLWGAKRPSDQPIVLRGHQSWVWAVAFSPDGSRVVSAGEDRTVRIWPARASVLAEDLCKRARRERLREEKWREVMGDIPYPPAIPCPAQEARQ